MGKLYPSQSLTQNASGGPPSGCSGPGRAYRSLLSGGVGVAMRRSVPNRKSKKFSAPASSTDPIRTTVTTAAAITFARLARVPLRWVIRNPSKPPPGRTYPSGAQKASPAAQTLVAPRSALRNALMGLIPIVGCAGIHAQRHRKVQGGMRRIGHHRGDQPERRLDFLGVGFEHELIVNLQQHLR